MTIIAATGGCIGSDSLVTDCDKQTVCKVLQKGHVKLGVAGRLKIVQVLRDWFDAPCLRKKDIDLCDDYMAREFIPELLKCLKEYGCILNSPDDGPVTIGKSEILAVCGQGIYTIHTDFTLMKASGSYAAIGSGSEYALGAMCNETKRAKLMGQGIETSGFIRTAIETAIEFDERCGGPVYII